MTDTNDDAKIVKLGKKAEAATEAPPPAPGPCKHETIEPLNIHDNENRKRVIERCTECGRTRMTTTAYKLASEPDEAGNREAWGPIGKTWSTEWSEPTT